MSICGCVGVFLFIYVCAYVCICLEVEACIYACADLLHSQLSLSMCMYVHRHVRMCLCLCTFVHMQCLFITHCSCHTRIVNVGMIWDLKHTTYTYVQATYKRPYSRRYVCTTENRTTYVWQHAGLPMQIICATTCSYVCIASYVCDAFTVHVTFSHTPKV